MKQLARMGLVAISESGIHQPLAETILAGYSNSKDKEVIPNAAVITGIGTVRDDEGIQGQWVDDPLFSRPKTPNLKLNKIRRPRSQSTSSL